MNSQRALVLAPHPDDESLGCGGTIKLITSGGGVVDVMYCTGGESGAFPGERLDPAARESMRQRRVVEALAACTTLGVRDVTFLNGPDGDLKSQPQLFQPILQALATRDYRSVFCPWPHDQHIDHAATYSMLHEALKRCARKFDVWLYEVWSPMTPSICIVIDSTIEAKMQAVAAHESQIKTLNYAEAFIGLARYRSLWCPPASYAEAFFCCESAALLRHEGIPWPK